MAYCPPGSTGIAKPGSPAAGFIVGETLVALLTDVFAIPAVWASIIAYAAGYSFTTATMCAADPPPMPTFTAADVLAILTSSAALSPASFLKLNQWITNAAWNQFCQCSPGATPAVPATPAFPAGAPTVNPTIPPILTSACFHGGTWFETNGFPVGCNYHSAFFPRGALPVGVTDLHVTHFSYVFAGPNPYPLTFTLTYTDIAGAVLGTNVWTQPAPILPAVNQEFYFKVPPGAYQWDVIVHAAACAGTTQGYDITFDFYCGQTPNVAVQPCCPPDPQLLGQLQQILNSLNTLQLSFPVALRSLAESTVHAALSGSGHFAVGASTIAAKVELTTIPLAQGRTTGDPVYYFEVGWFTTSAVEGDYQSTRIGHSPQIFFLDRLADTIHYTFNPGLVATITELTAGP